MYWAILLLALKYLLKRKNDNVKNNNLKNYHHWWILFNWGKWFEGKTTYFSKRNQKSFCKDFWWNKLKFTSIFCTGWPTKYAMLRSDLKIDFNLWYRHLLTIVFHKKVSQLKSHIMVYLIFIFKSDKEIERQENLILLYNLTSEQNPIIYLVI